MDISELVKHYRRNRETYTSGQYNETQLRREFLDPFFALLGWDIDNKHGYAEAYKDVVHEDAIKIGVSTKAPDYSFRIGGTRKFFVEAKKPSIHIKDDIDPAFQFRRYAWSAKLPLSILTNFEEFAVYDCRIKPDKTDKVSTGRILYITCDEYIEKWGYLSSIFSREALLQGSFDKYAESTKTKKGTAEVDTVFLKEIESWRELLARNLALRNPELTRRELNFVVQATIDRIVFLRICEDRGIEDYGRLMSLLNGMDAYKRLCQFFRLADDKYNSGLFHFRGEKDRPEPPDDLSLNMFLDDKTLKEIVKNLYYPDSPYEFSVLPADILGQVYEQFLGKVIHLSVGHRATIEDKPEVKKAGGVFYTPRYIVDYIVKNTVGKLLEGKTPKQAANLKILDPACGSGSFLIGAYQCLLDWHHDWYAEHTPEKWATGKKPALYQAQGGEWRLTTIERKRILLNNIYGVDIDPQAVEVTKLSLLLKVLEGATDQSASRQGILLHERVLPDLGGNIKCGNSLIGPDFYEGRLTGILDEEERLRVNVFDWKKELTEIMAGGGFDAVIGNPPYLRIQGLQEYYGEQIGHFTKNYLSAVKRFDLYLLFIEKGFQLLANGGKLGFICPHKFINSDFGSGLRKFLIDNLAIESMISFGNNLVFKQASTYTGILLLAKDNKTSFNYYEFPNVPVSELSSSLFQLQSKNFSSYSFSSFSGEPWVLAHKKIPILLKKLSNHTLMLGNICNEIMVGVQSGIDNIHVLKVLSQSSDGVLKLFSEKADMVIEIEAGLLKPFLRGEDVHRYKQPSCLYCCIYPYKLENDKTKILEETELKEKFPLGYSYLEKYRKELKEIRIRQKTNPKYWYSCHRNRDMKVFESERIITPEISLGCNMTITQKGIYHNTKVYSIVPSKTRQENLKYWLGILNSKVMWWFLSNTGYVLRGGYFVFKTNYLNSFPTRVIDFSNPTDVALHDRLAHLVDQTLTLHKQQAAAKTAYEKTAIERQINATDRQIDTLVYELYGLTEEEINIVEQKA